MRDFLGRNVRVMLYAVLALALTYNFVQIFLEQYLAAIPAVIQIIVLASIYTKKPWAYFAIRVWSILLIAAGASMWLAVLVGGAEFFHSSARAVILTLIFLLGIYFFIFAKRA